MVVKEEQFLNPLASALKVQLDQDSVEDNCRVTSRVFDLLKKSKSNLDGANSSEKAQIQQYIEYGIVYVAQIDCPQNVGIILKEFNEMLALKTYLVSNRLTVADVLLYYILFKTMDSLTIPEKEKYLNLCRWFDNIQQDATFRQSNKIIDFSTNYLANVVPPRH